MGSAVDVEWARVRASRTPPGGSNSLGGGRMVGEHVERNGVACGVRHSSLMICGSAPRNANATRGACALADRSKLVMLSCSPTAEARVLHGPRTAELVQARLSDCENRATKKWSAHLHVIALVIDPGGRRPDTLPNTTATVSSRVRTPLARPMAALLGARSMPDTASASRLALGRANGIRPREETVAVVLSSNALHNHPPRGEGRACVVPRET